MSNDLQLNALAAIGKAFTGAYETVAASQTAQVLGGTGAIGDVIGSLIITPTALTGVGVVTILDNAISIPIFAGGTLADFTPMVVTLNITSVSGPWKVTTGAALSVIAIGTFT